MHIPFRTTALLVPFAAITLFGNAPVVAETVSRTVSYADLNLSHPEGVATLERRIRQAARQICTAGGWSAYEQSSEIKCLKSAIGSTRTQVALAEADARQRLASADNAKVATAR